MLTLYFVKIIEGRPKNVLETSRGDVHSMTFQGRPEEISFVAFYKICFDFIFQIKLHQICVVFHRDA